MARRTKEQAEQTRQDILDAALDVFWEKGFVRTRLEDIAHRAGVTRGAIYFHFKDKVDLIIQLANSVDQSIELASPELLEQRAESLEEIQLGICAYIELFEKNKRFRKFYELVNYKIEWTQELDQLIARDRKQLHFLIDNISKDFKHLQDKNILPAGLDTDDEALGLCAMITGLIEFWLLDPNIYTLMDRVPAQIWKFLERMKSEE